MSISRSSINKRRATGGRRNHWRKSRKYELGRPPANTKLSNNKCVRQVRVRGGKIKFRALRLDHGNFSWASEAVTRQSRILGVVYNASNNELVRTNTLVKSAVVTIDPNPFRRWYTTHHTFDISNSASQKKIDFIKKSKQLLKKFKNQNLKTKLDPLLMKQFETGKLYACVSSRPGQCGRADGYILEGRDLEFYMKKLAKKKAREC